MTRSDVVRMAVVAFPLAAAIGIAYVRRPGRRLQTGVLLGLAWNAWAVLAVNLVAVDMGWWSFDPSLPSFMGVAIEPWLGWTLLWGAFVPLVAFDRPLVLTVTGLVWLDVIAMPLSEPVVVLGPSWLVGESLALLIALVPSLLLARWTARDTNLRDRAVLQILCAGGLLMWLVPSLALSRSGGWGSVLQLPAWRLSIGAQLMLIPVSLGVRSAVEFARAGRGTPIPYDPPQDLVTSGPYSFVRNPMQLAMVSIFAIASVTLWNAWLAVATFMAFAYGAGLAEWHENEELSDRFGESWQEYRERVRSWRPRWRPQVSQGSTLLVAFSCATCSSVGRWFIARHPVGLDIAPAEASGDVGIRRITYIPDSGPPSQGVAAIARGLEHIHLGWATIGWVLLLPGVLQLAQLISDVYAPSPGRVAGVAYDELACDVAPSGR